MLCDGDYLCDAGRSVRRRRQLEFPAFGISDDDIIIGPRCYNIYYPLYNTSPCNTAAAALNNIHVIGVIT